MQNEHIILVNNTGSDIKMFDAEILNAIYNNESLPEELADLFNLEIINVDGLPRGILTAA